MKDEKKIRNLEFQQRALSTPLKILLVDDDPLLRSSVSGLLESEGHTIVEASNTEEALNKIESDHFFDLIVSDYNMPPGKNGSGIYFHLKEKGLRIPFILISGNYLGIPEEEFNKMEELYAFLDKPYGITILVSYIQDIQMEKAEKSGFFCGDKR